MNLESIMPDHVRYWIDPQGQRRCSDCFPPEEGVVLLAVTSTFDGERYEREERAGIREG